jgi:hypothetical protein
MGRGEGEGINGLIAGSIEEILYIIFHVPFYIVDNLHYFIFYNTTFVHGFFKLLA